MDAPCKIQGSIHVFRLVNNMCPGKWVHIMTRGFLILCNTPRTVKNFHIIHETKSRQTVQCNGRNRTDETKYTSTDDGNVEYNGHDE